ncbi:MAG: CAP domain-containing protein [Bacteroidota bacterium]
MRILFSCILLFLIILPKDVKSQTYNRTDAGNINIKYLEYLLKQEIDSVRKSKGLDILINDSILYLASADQSKYLSSKKELTHFQKENQEKYSPQNRANYFGAVNYGVGENVLCSSLNYPLENLYLNDQNTYESIAHSMMELWVNSPGHYANIITRGYHITGVSVYYNPKKNVFYAAQVFAKVNPYYRYKNCSSFFPYEKYDEELVKKKFVPNDVKIDTHRKHAYKIKRESLKKKCCYDNQTSIFNYESVMLRLYKDSLYLGVEKSHFSSIKQFFKNKKDGILLEFLDFDYTYSCNLIDNTRVTTRENGGCIFNGIITRPVYRDSMLYYLDLLKKEYSRNNDYIFVPIGKYPDKLKGKKIDINFIILQKNRLCKIIESQGVCGALMEPEIPQFGIKLNLDSIKYRPTQEAKRKEFKVWFEQNSINIINPDTLYYIKKLLKKDDLFVSKIILNAYASVEGSLENNRYLYKKRAENIQKVFQSEQDSTIELTTITEENWKLFFSQLKTSKFSYLLELDTNQIKDSVNVPENARALENLLSKQRYGLTTVFYKPIINEQNIDSYALNEFKKLCQLQKPEYTHLNRLKKLTSFLLYRCLSGKIPLDSIKMYAPNNKKYNETKMQLLLYEIKYDTTNTILPDTALKFLKEYSINNNKDYTAKYNYFAYFLNYKDILNTKASIPDLKEFLNILKDSKTGENTTEAFELYYHFNYLNYLYYKGWTFASVEKSLNFIKEFYKKNPPNDDLRYQLALYFISFRQLQTSLELLEPLIQEDHYIKEAFILYLKLYDQLQMAGLKSNSEDLLIEAGEKLSTIDWCNLFIGPCNIRFQIFNNEALKMKYCEKCNSKK